MGLSGRVPARVDAATKAGLLELIEQAVEAGLDASGRACQELELGEVRAYRWLGRRAAGELADRRPGRQPDARAAGRRGGRDRGALPRVGRGRPLPPQARPPRLLPGAGVGRRRLRCAASSLLRACVCSRCPGPAGRCASRSRTGSSYRPNSIWIYDTTHFTRAGVAVTVIEDLVSPQVARPTSSRPRRPPPRSRSCSPTRSSAEGLLELVEARQDGLVDPTVDDPSRPILLAMSDNGPQMTSGSTREFMALCAIHQHFGRPGTPTDQAWIESLFGHVKAEWPHLLADRATRPCSEPSWRVVREHYNGVRLHAGIGYVTPDDEHQGRGPAIRKAREAGLEQARLRRLTYHRHQRHPTPPTRTIRGARRCWLIDPGSLSRTQKQVTLDQSRCPLDLCGGQPPPLRPPPVPGRRARPARRGHPPHPRPAGRSGRGHGAGDGPAW